MIDRLFAISPSTERPLDEPVSSGGASRCTDLDAAYAHCERITRDRWTDYALVSRFIPVEQRPDLWAVCAFARGADAIADEDAPESVRRAALDAWEEKLVAAWHGEADHPVFVALAHTAEQRDLPITPFSRLLDACRMDVAPRRYETWEALSAYLDRAAVPLGDLLLRLFGRHDCAHERYAADLATALLFTHLLGDVRTDLARGRLYLPLQDLVHFEVREADLAAASPSPAVAHLYAFEAARVHALYMRGRPLLARLDGPVGDIVRLLWHRGRSLLDRLEGERSDEHVAAEAARGRR